MSMIDILGMIEMNTKRCSICDRLIRDDRPSSICQECEDRAECEARGRGE